MAETSSTMELNLRLDGEGRTTYDPLALLAAAEFKTTSDEHDHQDEEESNTKKAKLEEKEHVNQTSSTTSLDYSSKTTMTNLASHDISSSSSLDNNNPMNDLLFDCEITDCGLLPRTFWVSATCMEPRCYLEQMALEIFNHHVPDDFTYDRQTSGAEWWVQIRPNPPAGRYSMHGDKDDPLELNGINFHWDKDEDLRLMCGGTMYIHPHISTVTYLTDLGAPTVVVSRRVNPMTGELIQESSDGKGTEGFVSWPKQGKHLSFDGRLLHAAPSDLMQDGMFEQQCRYDVSSDMDDKTRKVLARQKRRVTFLVNIWLNYKPFNVNPFPDTMVGKLSKVNLFGSDARLFGSKEEDSKDANRFEKKEKKSRSNLTNIIVSDDEATLGNGNKTELTKKKWPMGQKNESIEVLMPVNAIRDQQHGGSDVAIVWKNGVVCIDDDSKQASNTD